MRNSILTLPVALLAVTPTLALVTRALPPPHLNLFSFGSSWTSYTFNVNGEQPSVENPLGNPKFGDQNNAQGGANYVQYLTVKHNPKLTFSYDLAVGGAGVSNAAFGGGPKEDLVYQIKDIFDPKYGSKKGQLWNSDDSIFIIFMGNNDVNRGRTLEASKVEGVVNKLIAAYFDSVRDLLSHGARQFLFVGVTAQDRSPQLLHAPKAEQEGYLRMKHAFNDALARGVVEFQHAHPEAKTELFDSSAWLNRHLDNPGANGFKDNTCMNDREKCMWNNDFHLTPRMHELMSRAMLPQLQKVGFVATPDKIY